MLKRTPHLSTNRVDISLDITHSVVSLWSVRPNTNEECIMQKHHLLELLTHMKDNFTDGIVSLHTAEHVANIHISHIQCEAQSITVTDGIFSRQIPLDMITDAKFYKQFDPS